MVFSDAIKYDISNSYEFNITIMRNTTHKVTKLCTGKQKYTTSQQQMNTSSWGEGIML